MDSWRRVWKLWRAPVHQHERTKDEVAVLSGFVSTSRHPQQRCRRPHACSRRYFPKCGTVKAIRPRSPE